VATLGKGDREILITWGNYRLTRRFEYREYVYTIQMLSKKKNERVYRQHLSAGWRNTAIPVHPLLIRVAMALVKAVGHKGIVIDEKGNAI
jgi:hypothetical protein